MQALRYETPEFLEHDDEEEEEEEEEEEGQTEDKNDLSLEATYSEGEPAKHYRQQILESVCQLLKHYCSFG